MPILDLIEAEAEGALSASLIESRIDPESWFGRRGVSQVVRVLASGDEGAPAAEPEDGGDQGPDGRESPTGEIPFNADLSTSGRTSVRAERSTMTSGTPIGIARLRQGHHWILVPHVDPAPAGHKKAFIKEIREALQLRRRERITSTRLADALRNPTEIRNLRNCYERIVAGGSRGRHNRVSMSLYSGPAGGKNAPSWLYRIVARSAGWPRWWFGASELPLSPEAGEAVGWIGTGDAALSDESVRKARLGTYRPFSRHLSTMLLPHHGSRHNFHQELLDFPESAHLSCFSGCSVSIQTSRPVGHWRDPESRKGLLSRVRAHPHRYSGRYPVKLNPLRDTSSGRLLGPIRVAHLDGVQSQTFGSSQFENDRSESLRGTACRQASSSMDLPSMLENRHRTLRRRSP